MATTSYKISTITAVGHTGVSSVDLQLFYQLIDVEGASGGFVHAEYGRRSHGRQTKGLSVSKRAKVISVEDRAAKQCSDDDRSSKKSTFDNQVTLKFVDDVKNVRQYFNLKLFKNGKVQMTGLKDEVQGRELLEHLVRCLESCRAKCPQVCPSAPVPCDFRVCLINSDFNIGFKIKRDKLFGIMLESYRDVLVTFEPCIYPGVKVVYFWNRRNASKNVGACTCPQRCTGRGEGESDGQCRKVTIAIFQSGCIIITGARTIPQLNDAYEFIKQLLIAHRALIQISDDLFRG